MGRCLAEDCWECSGAGAKSPTARRRADMVEEYLGRDRQNRNVGILILTVPKDRRHLFHRKSQVKAIRKRVNRRILRGVLGMDYGLDSAHPVGEDGTTFHPHHNFLYLAKRKRSPFPTKPQLGEIRKIWADILEIEESELETKGNEVTYNGAVVIYHKYVKWDEIGRRKHMCRYFTRPFVGWSWWRGNSIVRLGRKLPKKEKVRPLCGECGKQTHTTVGFTKTWVFLAAAAFPPEMREKFIDENTVRHRRDLLRVSRVLGSRAPPLKVG